VAKACRHIPEPYINSARLRSTPRGGLLKNGRRIKLQEQPYRLLVALLEAPGEVISREELRSRLWRDDTFVDFDGSLRVAVRKLREALDDDADNPRYIETIPKRGYRFLVPEIRRIDAPPQAASLSPDLSHDPEPVTVGATPAPEKPKHNPMLRYRIAAVALLTLTAGGVFLWQQSTPAKPLTDKDVLVLADFANTTGDRVFDGTLRQALAIQLEQSPLLKIMDDEQVQQTMRLMSLSRVARITNQVAHDICVRDAAAATIDGSIASLGKSYVLTLEAIACPSGATLAREQVQAQDKERVLSALGIAATAMRARLGESRSSIQRSDRPLEEATTPSLEALQSYTKGHSEMEQSQIVAAIASFERAAAIDPNFAMAYFYLGVAFENAGDMERSRENAKQAFRLIDRVSEYERAQIAPYYYRATGEVYKEIDAWQWSIRNYPRHWEFQNQLGLVHVDLGQFDEGLKEGLEAARLQAIEPPYRRQLDAYICLNRLAEARQLAEKLRNQRLDGPRIHQRFLEMAYVEGDGAAIAREIEWFAGKPEEYLSFGLQAANLNVLGQRRESSKLYKRAAETALRRGLRDAASEFEEANARADAFSGKCETARRLGRPAVALAMCGDVTRVEKLASEASNRFPDGTLWNAVQLPEIRAAIELQRGKPAKAVELLASASPYERSYLNSVYLRGLAYLRLHKGFEAAAEFQKILDHKGANWAATWVHPYWGQVYSLSYLGLARASVLAGDPTKARRSFKDFFALWKDADQDLPVLIEARKDYAALH